MPGCRMQNAGAMFQTLAESFDLAVEEMVASLRSEAFKEGVAHFLGKRAPVFKRK
jgi:enoyl-CoA hydratase/carnithine racemase